MKKTATGGNFHFGVEIPLNDAEPPNKRFAAVNDENVEDMGKKKQAANTTQSTNFVKVLRTYCNETGQGFSETEEMTNNEQLNVLLSRFYIAARKTNGERYKVNSLKSLRFALQRHFLEKREVDIIDDMRFKTSGVVFDNVLKETKADGFGDTEHYPEVEPEDLTKLYSSFDINTPTGLLEIVWFNIMYFLCRRGRQNLRKMTKYSHAVSTDATGRRYIHKTNGKGEADKNHNENDDTNDTTGEGVIYETGNDKCPVKCYLKYISLLNPHLDALWQRPRPSVTVCDRIWYCNAPLGEKSLGDMLPNLSLKYRLSRRYTNHSLRVSSMQVMEDGNVAENHIMRVSGHKSRDSVANYARRLSAARKRKISSVLSSGVGENVQPPRPPQPAVQPVRQQQPKVANHQQPPTVFPGNQSFAATGPQMFTANARSEQNFSNVEIFPDDPVGDDILSSLSTDLMVYRPPGPPPRKRQPTAYEIVPGVFAPVLHNCNNITFNVNVYNSSTK